MICPPVISRLARRRSTSISRPCGDLDHGAERARGDERERRERHPVGVPAAGRALMLLDLGGEQGRDEIRRDRRGRERRRGADRIALVRQRRGAAAAGRARLERLADFGLHHQRDVARDLAAGAGQDAEAGGDLGQPVAVGVPGRVGQVAGRAAPPAARPRPCRARRAPPACRRRRRIAAPAPRGAAAASARASARAPRHSRQASARTASAARAASACARPRACGDGVRPAW